MMTRRRAQPCAAAMRISGTTTNTEKRRLPSASKRMDTRSTLTHRFDTHHDGRTHGELLGNCTSCNHPRSGGALPHCHCFATFLLVPQDPTASRRHVFLFSRPRTKIQLQHNLLSMERMQPLSRESYGVVQVAVRVYDLLNEHSSRNSPHAARSASAQPRRVRVRRGHADCMLREVGPSKYVVAASLPTAGYPDDVRLVCGENSQCSVKAAPRFRASSPWRWEHNAQHTAFLGATVGTGRGGRGAAAGGRAHRRCVAGPMVNRTNPLYTTIARDVAGGRRSAPASPPQDVQTAGTAGMG